MTFALASQPYVYLPWRFQPGEGPSVKSLLTSVAAVVRSRDSGASRELALIRSVRRATK